MVLQMFMVLMVYAIVQASGSHVHVYHVLVVIVDQAGQLLAGLGTLSNLPVDRDVLFVEVEMGMISPQVVQGISVAFGRQLATQGDGGAERCFTVDLITIWL
jgi:hypothetical protein